MCALVVKYKAYTGRVAGATLEDSYLEQVQSKRAAAATDASRNQRSKETTDAIKSGSDAVVAEVARQGARTRQSTQKVNVTNDIATRSDIDSVINQLKEVQLAALLGGHNKPSVILADSTDLGVRLQEMGDRIVSVLQSDSDDTSEIDAIRSVCAEYMNACDAFQQATTKQTKLVVEALGRLEQSIGNINIAPKVNVPAPIVNIPDSDDSAVIAAIDRLNATVEASRVDIPETDDTELLSEVASVRDAITSLRFPVPNFIQDPLIRYKIADLDDASSIKYYGFVDPEGHWYIMKEDASGSPTTYRYCFGTGSASGGNKYETQWTARASLDYSYLYAVMP